jgi:phosphocarrier protein HPr
MGDGPLNAHTARKVVKIVNKQGWHARPSALVVKAANKFKSDIRITINGETANGKSIMEVIMLASPVGTEVRIEATGEDSEASVEAIASLVLSGFGEEMA